MIVKRIIPDSKDPVNHVAILGWKSLVNGENFGEYQALESDPTDLEIEAMRQRGVKAMGRIRRCLTVPNRKD